MRRVRTPLVVCLLLPFFFFSSYAAKRWDIILSNGNVLEGYTLEAVTDSNLSVSPVPGAKPLEIPITSIVGLREYVASRGSNPTKGILRAFGAFGLSVGLLYSASKGKFTTEGEIVATAGVLLLVTAYVIREPELELHDLRLGTHEEKCTLLRRLIASSQE